MELATRRVVCAGVTPHPGAEWMLQIGRNLTDAFSGFIENDSVACSITTTVMQRDESSFWTRRERDTSFHDAFRGLLEQAGVRAVRTPARSPNCNAHLERFHGSFKREVADRMIFFGQRHLQYAIDEFLEYYHRERNLQGLGGQIIDPLPWLGAPEGKVRRRERLGGMLNHYYRDAA